MTEEHPPESPSTNGNQGVQLGIGTLIIIALIVTMCSGKGDMEKLRSDTAALKQQVGELDRKVDTLLQKEGAAPAPQKP